MPALIHGTFRVPLIGLLVSCVVIHISKDQLSLHIGKTGRDSHF